MNPIESKKCPYCNILLDKEPSKRKTCENCKNIYYIRTCPSDYKRMIVTEKEKYFIDQQWRERYITLYGNHDSSINHEYKPKTKNKIDYSGINPNKFITLDFETANEKRCSICSMGVVIVEKFNIIEKKHWYIKPQELKFNKSNIKKHGITKDMMINEPEFNELWENIKNYFDKSIVFCHNISFDMYSLKEILQNYNIEFPDFYYQDSMQIAKKIWGYLPNFRLKTIMEKLNIETNFHNSYDDAVSCSNIIINSCKKLNVDNIIDLLKKIKIDLRLFPPEPGIY